MRRAGRLRLCLAMLSLLQCPTSAQVAPKAQNRVLRLDQGGAGLWTQHGRPDGRITHVSVGGNPAQRLGIEFSLAGGGRRALSGTIEGKDAYSLRLKLSNSGNADASGTILIEYGSKNTINALFGSGFLDGQPFAAQFTRAAPLQFNLTAPGRGTWSIPETSDVRIQRVSFLSDMGMKAEAAFFLADGGIRRLSGLVTHSAVNQSLILTVSSAGMADASGSLTLRLDKKNRLVSVEGEIKADDRPFQVKFEAADPHLPPQAAMIDANVNDWKKIEGKLTQGDASTSYSAYVDDSWVRRIDATLNQKDYGSSQRRIYFTKDQLFYYTESGERRDTSAAGQGKLDKVELKLSLDSQGRVLEAYKTVNGALSKLSDFDVSGAKNYAEMLRKEVEENAVQSQSPPEPRLP